MNVYRSVLLALVVCLAAGCSNTSEQVTAGDEPHQGSSLLQSGTSSRGDATAVAACSKEIAKPAFAAVQPTLIAAFDTTLAQAYRWRDQFLADAARAIGAEPLQGTVDYTLRADEQVSICFVDGSFASPGPPDAVELDRSAFAVTGGGQYVALAGGASRDTSAGPAMPTERP